jgi:putative methionine-R-sulfoxide reductase with GAF domain
MPSPESTPLEAFVPALAWGGRRPSLAELSTWHEALRDAVGQILPLDLLACWLLPSRGGSLLIGPAELAADGIPVPTAEPLVGQEAQFQLEDRIRAGGYRSVMVVPIRAEVQDVGLLAIGRFNDDAYSLADLRTLHRVAAMLATSCRRLAAQPWITPAAHAEERPAVVAGVAEAVLEAMDRARNGGHPSRGVQLQAIDLDRIDALVHHLGARETIRIADLRALGLEWPGAEDRRSAERQQSLCAARLEVGGEMVGWLWLGSDAPGWFRENDEEVTRLVARLLASRVATWTARHELAGAWG